MMRYAGQILRVTLAVAAGWWLAEATNTAGYVIVAAYLIGAIHMHAAHISERPSPPRDTGDG